MFSFPLLPVMGGIKLFMLLLLSSYALAQQGNENAEQTSTCVLASRYKAYKKYVYQYSTQSQNGVVGADSLRNGPMLTCQVEVEVPQVCKFILHTRSCALSEVSSMDAGGRPVYGPAATSDAFEAAMAKNPLKFTVEQVTTVHLYPEPDEQDNLLNVKRGIVSALLAPVEEEQHNRLMNTVHGVCATEYTINAQKDIATDVSLSRDLSGCDQFYGRVQDSSPLALIQKLHQPMAKLIRSTQHCNYQFDNRRKHMSAAECTETHVFLPFSHKDNGMSSVVTQRLTLQESQRINSRNFEVEPWRSSWLHFQKAEGKAPVQTGDGVLRTLEDLKELAGTGGGQRRAGLFHMLVSGLRGLRNETLSSALPRMLDASAALTWQALLQCGTAECDSAALQAVRTVAGMPLEMDALVHGLSLQGHADAGRVRDMLSTAKFRQSKAIMYALAYTVRRFYRNSEGLRIPELTEVSDFMATILEDCSVNPEESFLALQVVGVMGRVIQKDGDQLIPSILRCAQSDTAPQSNQKAAIQAFRRMSITDEIQNVLMEICRNPQSPVEHRVAAYLTLMKRADQAMITQLLNSLAGEEEPQLKNFVFSHLDNIRNSLDPDMQRMRSNVEAAWRGQPSSSFRGPSTSGSYRLETPLGSVQTNLIFDGADTLPKELMLETTLRVLDFREDIFEVGVEGKGFEPTLDALFGERGFFPEAASNSMYNSGAYKVPKVLQRIFDRLAPDGNRMKRQLPQDLLLDIKNSFNALLQDIGSYPPPEATAYLTLLGREMGYIKSSEVKQMADTLYTYYQTFFKQLPAKAIAALTSSTENDLFAHYIFMENVMSLPTASGLPLKFSLAGVISPGARGGLNLAPGMQLSFMPSVGLEFITQMGVHLPDFVVAGLEMHTNMHHESSFNAKVTMTNNQFKLSIPALKTNTLFSFSNKVQSVSSSGMATVPSMVEDKVESMECDALFPGLKLCTAARYPNVNSTDETPYYPLTGETRFAIEIQPTGEVSEYIATLTGETLREGKDGRHKVDSLKLSLKAEGTESKEATAILKYNRNKNIFTTEVNIPDFDMELGIKLAVTDTNVKGKKMKGVTFDVTNKNIPQLTLVARTRLEMMKNAMLELQMAIPSLKADSALTLTLKNDDAVIMAVEAALNLPETTSVQKVTLIYDDNKFEVEMNSDTNSDIQKLIPNIENYHRQLQQHIDALLDQRVAQTDMKLRHIVTKGIEAGNIWLDKLSASIPSIEKLRSKRSISDLTLPALPERLFFQADSLFRYQFNKDKMDVNIPLPLGGKSSEEIHFPATLSVPNINIPTLGVHIPAKTYPVPTFTIPRSVDFTVPLLGLFEASTKINSNLYNWEGSIAGGNNTMDVPNYIVQYKAMAQSPFNPLSYTIEGTGMVSGKVDNVKYILNGSLSHSLIDASFSISEGLRMIDNLIARVNYKLLVSSPLGLQSSLDYSAISTSTADKVTGDGKLDGLLEIGPLHTTATYTQSYILLPQVREGRGESSLRISSPLIQLNNIIQGVYANNELNIVSKTNVQDQVLQHVSELKYKGAQVTLKSNVVAAALGKMLNNKLELGLSSQLVIFRIESQADDATNRAFSLLTGTVTSYGLEVNSEGSLTSNVGRALHKASLTINQNGVTTSGTNNIQCSPVTFENVFNSNIDQSGVTLSSLSKAMAEEARGELNIEVKVTTTEASLNGVFKGFAHDASTRNNLNFLLNRRTLSISSNSMGSLKQRKTENSHTLVLTLWTADLHSKTDNFICEDVYYKHDIKINMKPFVMSIDVTNDLKLQSLNFNNEGHLRLQPIMMDLTGSLKGANGEVDQIKHTYQIKYADMAGTMNSSTSGRIMDVKLSHNCEFEFAGLASKSICEAQVTSESLRFDGNIRTMAVPFSFTLDGLINSDGELNLFGKHTGQLYSKLLIKAEPAALAYSHDCQVSTKHTLESGVSSAHIDNKCNGLLTPSKQSLNWKSQSKMNRHDYNQEINTYNDPAKIGFEFSGVLLTDLFSQLNYIRETKLPEIQEFKTSGFLKYDKNSDCHTVEIPFIESLPAAFDIVKEALLKALESLQQYVNRIDVNLLIKQFRTRLNQIPMEVNDLIRQMDLEIKVKEIKEKVTYLTKDFSVTIDDLELAVEKLKTDFGKTVIEIAHKVQNVICTIKDFVSSGDFYDFMSNTLSKIGNKLMDFDQNYKIRLTLIKALNSMEDIVSQIDLKKLTESSLAWLQDLDAKYNILEKIKKTIATSKHIVETFDVKMFFQDLRDDIISLDIPQYVQQLSYDIPYSDITNVIESMKDILINWIDEYEIPNKLNAVYFYIRDLIVKYDLDEKFKDLLDQLVVLIKELEIEKTVQLAVDHLKALCNKCQYIYDEIMQFIFRVTEQFKLIDWKQIFQELNRSISSILNSMKKFDYNSFVDESNERIAEAIKYLNEQIKTYGIVDKIEATRDFIRERQTSIIKYIEELKNTKVAEVLQKFYDVINTTAYIDMKMKVKEILEDTRQRVLGMDIKDEIYIHLQRLSEFYSNMITFISEKLSKLMAQIHKISNEQDIIHQIEEGMLGVLDALKRVEIVAPSFKVPLTDLTIPQFKIKLNKLQEISIPDRISVPGFTIFNFVIPSFTIDFKEIKTDIIAIIDRIREYEIPMIEPDEIFGDLKVLYLFNLPDLTLPEITLSEIKFPVINIPKLNLGDFSIKMLPIPEITEIPEIPSEICLPVFGKLYSEFRLDSPFYTLVTTVLIQNSTTTFKTPQFTAFLTSKGMSNIDLLDYSLDAMARVEAPRMKKLMLTETLKVTHVAFSIDHEGSLTITGPSAEVAVTTTAKITTKMNSCNLVNKGKLTLNSGVTAAVETTYNHNLNIPMAEISSEATMTQYMETKIESGIVSGNIKNIGNGKWSIQDYSDEGTHKCDLEFTVNFGTATLTIEGETKSNAIQFKKYITAESVILSHIIVDAKAEAELPFLKSSVFSLKGEAHVEDLKIALTTFYDAELIGRLSGPVSHSLEFLVQPFEIVLNCKNKCNAKISLPLKLTGKSDFQHDFGLILNPEQQRLGWAASTRFNQYKYNHNYTMENNDMELFLHATAYGEANLDFLTLPLSIPEITVPYLEIKTPELKEFSIWEHAGIGSVLTTPQQTFDMNLDLHFHKNPQMQSINVDLGPIYSAIGDILPGTFEDYRDMLVNCLKDSYNQAKKHYTKHNIETPRQPPRNFMFPQYTVPILNIEVSAFTAEMPAFSYFVPKAFSTPSFKVPVIGFSVPSYALVLPSLELPVIHLPETLNKLTLPTITLPAIQNKIWIPSLGNVSHEFSFKSSLITLRVNADLFNQSDIVAQFGALSTSVFDFLNGKLDGAASLTRKRGIEFATSLSVVHQNLKANHVCAVSLTKQSMESSMANTAKLDLPFLTVEVDQELLGNTRTKPNVASKMKLKYMFTIPLIHSVAKGNIDHNLMLEALTSYVSLDTSTKGKTDVLAMDSYSFEGDLENEANFYINANGLRSAFKFLLISNIDRQQELRSRTNIFHLDIDKRSALEVSLQRLYATMEYTSHNNANFAFVDTLGKHTAKGTLEFVPLTTLKATLDSDALQSSAALIQNLNLAISREKQAFTWHSGRQLGAFSNAIDLVISNDEAEVRMDMTCSVEAYIQFLKSLRLPVYHRSLWDVLRFDHAQINDPQLFNASFSIVYTKSQDGTLFSIPSQILDNGVTFSIPELTLAMPGWVKQIPSSIRKIDMRIENLDFPDHFILPPGISIPALDVPFTTLQVQPFIVDMKNLNIPKTISTKAFYITLPGLPTISIPRYNIDTQFLPGKMSFLSLKIPQHEISISAFQLPSESPFITIPQQTMEIPEIAIFLPSSVFIPMFGALTATWNISLPGYNVATTAKVEKKDSHLVTAAKSTCSSTMNFLEYDLDAAATLGFDNGLMDLNSHCNFVHSDVNVAWQHTFAQNMRVKRQTAEAVVSHHTVNVDITSPTFADLSFRYASRKDGITASMSSPSSGFLGLYLQRRSLSQLHGKLFSRYLRNPGKDIDILSVKATIKNSEKLSMITSWNIGVLGDFIEGLKGRLPAITEAVLKFINKYHTAHFGFDLNRGGIKFRNTLTNAMEQAHKDVAESVTALQELIDKLGSQSMAFDLNVHISNSIRKLSKYAEQVVENTIEAILTFLRNVEIPMPGSDQKQTGLQVFQRACRYISDGFDRAMQRFSRIMNTVTSNIRGIEFTIPATDVVVKGQEIREELTSAWKSLLERRVQALQIWREISLEKLFQSLSDFLQMFVQKADELIASLRAENPELASRMDGIYAEGENALISSKQHIEDAKKHLAQYKDHAKLNIQEVYNGMSMERINSDLEDLINIVQLHLYGGLEEFLVFLEDVIQDTGAFRFSHKSLNIDIPLPFLWTSFAEWPMIFRTMR
ncbi:apolipoprotein B-100 isoform X2 [Gadus chalcogrammus]|uniref:apolipoprotein B-100 isoform X2 n=1 Tax=Gadus chalcogrammus TaxID=1042646 RepID=UPI0024C2E90B|nr:apolipoprotein B-100 isoform X2 [Gadus chalcogrammus]